jgi:hypothetical protein
MTIKIAPNLPAGPSMTEYDRRLQQALTFEWGLLAQTINKLELSAGSGSGSLSGSFDLDDGTPSAPGAFLLDDGGP